MTNQNEHTEEKIKTGPIAAVLVLGAFVATLNQTLMNVALPVMMEDLQIDANKAQWLTTAFMLVNGVLIPITAFLMERFSTRKLYITAMSLFSIGTLVCAVGPGFSFVLLGRIIQAAGAGIMMPLMMNVFLTIYPVEKRGTAMGVMGLAMVFAPAIGPTLSGWIVEHYSWRVIFYILIPLTLINIAAGIIYLRNVTKLTHPKVDILGIILSTLGFGGLLYGFSLAGDEDIGWGSLTVLVSIGVGIVSLALFIWRQFTVKRPMLEFRVFKYNMYSLTTLINVVITMAMFSAMILLPIYLQTIRGFSPLESGLLLLPGAILMGIMSPIAGRIFDKVGARGLAVVGLSITTYTNWELAHLTDSTTYLFLILLYSARMFGMSMLMMPIMTAGMNQLPRRLNPHGTAMSNTMRQISGALGTAFLVTVMTNQTKVHYKDIVASAGISPDDQLGMSNALNEATIQGINDSFMLSTWLTVIALLLSFFIKRVTPPQEQEQEQDQAKTAKQGEGEPQGVLVNQS